MAALETPTKLGFDWLLAAAATFARFGAPPARDPPPPPLFDDVGGDDEDDDEEFKLPLERAEAGIEGIGNVVGVATA